jgi:dUTP pyrophosphatase
VLLVNHGSEPFTIESGDRIAQLIVAPVVQVEIEVVEGEAALGGTERGDGGFGSTGV